VDVFFLEQGPVVLAAGARMENQIWERKNVVVVGVVVWVVGLRSWRWRRKEEIVEVVGEAEMALQTWGRKRMVIAQ
jgi:hypothetical protein